jgi:hypothetical protein
MILRYAGDSALKWPCGHRLQLTTDLVPGEPIDMVAWTVRSWRNVGSGGCGFALESVA